MLQAIQEIYQFRELLLHTVIREFKVKYGKSMLGILWVFIKPAVMITMFTFIFSKVYDGKTEHLWVQIAIGIITWNMFSSSVNMTAKALKKNKNLFRKIYLPKTVPLIAPVCIMLAEYFLSFSVLQAILFWVHDFDIGFGVVIISGALLFVLSVGFGFYVSVLVAFFDDILHLIEFVVRIGFWITPVVYTIRRLPKEYHWIAEYNPVALIIETIRLSFIPNYDAVNTQYYPMIFAIVFFVFISGFFFFVKFADRAVEAV